MPARDTSPDVVIVGGGIIGLSIAWRARARGLTVTLLERDVVGCGTSRVAAGMLAPVAEVEFGTAGRRLLELGLRSAQLWPGFVVELQEASGMEVELFRTGTLLVARDADEAAELERQLAYRQALGLPAERLRASAAREREPGLAPTVRMAIEAPDDHSVEPRRVLRALSRACELAGVEIREHVAVESVRLEDSGERVMGLTVRSVAPAGDRAVLREEGCDEDMSAKQLVIAAGPWSARIDGLPSHAQVGVRPVKGQILRLRDPAGPGLVTRVVRYAGGYLVPRGDGRYVLGASVEERGFDLTPTAGVVYELLRDASELVPGIDELQIEEISVGLRPGSPDNTPAIGPGAVQGLVWATGHYRNGILLAPLTAEMVVQQLAGEPAPSRAAETCQTDRPRVVHA
jgi:glycine oxidase